MGILTKFIDYLNPFTYYLDGVIGATASDVQVECTTRELATFNPPPGETCGSYAGSFAQSSGGYLVDEGAFSNCQYCPMSNSSAFLEQKHVFYGDGWPWGYFGIFTLFVFFNFALTLGLYYLTKRVKLPNALKKFT